MKISLFLKKTILAGLMLAGATAITPAFAANTQPEINLSITSKGITAADSNSDQTHNRNIGKEDILPITATVDKGNDSNVVFDHLEVSLGATSNYYSSPLIFPNDKDARSISPSLNEGNSFEALVKGQYDGTQELSVQGFWNINGTVQPVGDKFIINVIVR